VLYKSIRAGKMLSQSNVFSSIYEARYFLMFFNFDLSIALRMGQSCP